MVPSTRALHAIRIEQQYDILNNSQPVIHHVPHGIFDQDTPFIRAMKAKKFALIDNSGIHDVIQSRKLSQKTIESRRLKKLNGQGSMPDLINDGKYNINSLLDNLPSSNDLNE